MYHTGTPETGWRRQALMNAESAVCVLTPRIVSQGRQRRAGARCRFDTETPR
jgi:hypothetical protein